jgi:hypothetical protein
MVGSPHYQFICLALFLMIGPQVNIYSQRNELVSATGTRSCQNFIYINCESNVSQFSFRYNTSELSGKGNIVSRDTGTIEISIPIREFEPSNPLMYGDFLNLMKASEYPRIKVAFSKQQLQSFRQGLPGSCPDIRITIAGISRTYKIQCSLINCSENLYLRGEKIIRLTDFLLQPPEKMLGLVKVNDEINVNFGFIITFADNHPISAKL